MKSLTFLFSLLCLSVSLYFPLLLIGVILVVVFGKLRGTLFARYEQLELQRMQSMDI